MNSTGKGSPPNLAGSLPPYAPSPPNAGFLSLMRNVSPGVKRSREGASSPTQGGSLPPALGELTATIAFENFRSKFNHALLIESNSICRLMPTGA